MNIPKLGKKGKTQLSAGICLLIFLGVAIAASGTGVLVWYLTKPTVPPQVPPIPLADALTTTYNGETERNVPIEIRVKDLFDPDMPTINGIEIQLFVYGFSPQAMIAKGLDPNEASLLDTFSTDEGGVGTSNDPFRSTTLLTAVVGDPAETNKSQAKDFVVQGADGLTVPDSVDCGVFFYAVMTEEAETLFTWCDKEGTAITEWNYTADADGVLDAKIKLVMSTSGESLRSIWSRQFGTLKLMLVVKVYHEDSEASAAIDIESTHYDWGTPGNQLVFVIKLSDIIYEVDSSGAIEDGHESYRLFNVRLDMTGCGFTAANTTAFLIGGWCLIEQDYDQVINGGLPSGNSADWFQDALTNLTVVTTDYD